MTANGSKTVVNRVEFYGCCWLIQDIEWAEIANAIVDQNVMVFRYEALKRSELNIIFPTQNP